MPMLIEHIDAIARKKQRDVLYLVFKSEKSPGGELPNSDAVDDPFSDLLCDWENLPVRQQITEWLESNEINWRPCGYVANTNMMIGYQGQIYIDVPFDTTLPDYKKLAGFLENPDGTMRLSNTLFCYLPLEHAMKNAHHDEPLFWEKWAENF